MTMSNERKVRSRSGVQQTHDAAREYDFISQMLLSLSDAIRKSTNIGICAHTELSAAGRTVTYLTGLSNVLQVLFTDAGAGAGVHAMVLSHLPAGPYRRARNAPAQLESCCFQYERSGSRPGRWIHRSGVTQSFSSEELARHLATVYIRHWATAQAAKSVYFESGQMEPEADFMVNRLSALKNHSRH